MMILFVSEVRVGGAPRLFEDKLHTQIKPQSDFFRTLVELWGTQIGSSCEDSNNSQGAPALPQGCVLPWFF